MKTGRPSFFDRCYWVFGSSGFAGSAGGDWLADCDGDWLGDCEGD